MPNPTQGFDDLFPPQESAGAFDDLFPQSIEETDSRLFTARGRLSAEQQSLINTRDKLLAIKPANAGHAARIKKLIESLDMQISGHTQDRSAISNFGRGVASGIGQGLQFPLELAADAAGLVQKASGNSEPNALQKYIGENRALLQEAFDPEGKSGAVGEFVGNIIGSLPAAQAVASGTASAILKAAPSSRLAAALRSAGQGSFAARAGKGILTNVGTGLPVNVAMSLGSEDMPIPEDATPEEAARIREANVENKIKQLAIGIGADIVSGATLHPFITRNQPIKLERSETPVVDENVLTPERQAQLNKVKAQNAVATAAKRRDNLNKKLAESEWRIKNPDMDWKELAPAMRRKVYDDWKAKQSDSNLNTSPTPTAQPQDQAGAMDQQLKELEATLAKMKGERDEATRMAETDDLLGVGNRRALMRASESADKNTSLAYIFFDSNGQKSINDKAGYSAGNQFLTDMRDVVIDAIQNYGIEPRIFRWGGDELVAIVPKDIADQVRSWAERTSVKEYEGVKGSLSGEIFDRIADAEGIDGKNALAKRKIEAKARHGIPGRDAEEQALIDGIKQQLDTEAAIVQPPEGVPANDFPPEALTAIRMAREGGGLQTEQEMREFAAGIANVYASEGTPEGRAMALQALVDESIPFDTITHDYEVEATHPEIVGENAPIKDDFTATIEQQRVDDREPTIQEYLDMPYQELQQRAKDKIDEEVNIEKLLFGEDGAKKYNQAYRVVNSPRADPESEKFQKAEKLISDMESSLTKAQQDKLFGRGQSGLSGEELRQAGVDAYYYSQDNTFDLPLSDLYSTIGRELTSGKPAENLPSAIRLKGAVQSVIRRTGDDPKTILSTALLHRVNEGWVFPHQAVELLEANLRDLQAAGISLGDTPIKASTVENSKLLSRGEPQKSTSSKEVQSEVIAKESQASTFLESYPSKKSLEEMTEKQLDKVDDKLLAALESLSPDAPERAIVQADFDLVRKEYSRRNALQKEKESITPKVSTPTQTVKTIQEQIKAADLVADADARAARVSVASKKSPRKMSGDELEQYKVDLEATRDLSSDPDVQKAAQDRLNKVIEEQSVRVKAATTPPPVPNSVVQGLSGFAFGFGTGEDNSDSENDRITNGLMWAGLLATGGLMAARMRAKARDIEVGRRMPSEDWVGSKTADEKMVSYADVENKQKSWRERSREWYSSIVRRTYGLDRSVNIMTGSRVGSETLRASKNPAKLAAMFGRWISQTEGALMDKPMYLDYAGNPIQVAPYSFREISDLVDGDLKGLGKLMMARTSLERQGLHTVPLDEVTANSIFHSSPENYHQAADALRQYDLGLAKILELSGGLPVGSTEKFQMEQFFASLKKVFDSDGEVKIVRDPKDPRGKKVIFQSTPIKGRKHGQAGRVYNPAETSALMTAQIYRAAELNEIKSRLVDLWEAAGMPSTILKQVERRRLPATPEHQMKIDALRQEISGMSEGEAEALVGMMDSKSLDPRSNTMMIYRDGVLKAYRVSEELATAMTSLTPDELEGLWKVLALPAGVARKGVVLNPYFVLKQSFIDGWQAMLNSQYGFRPGIDQFLGWYNIVRHTPEYKNFLAAGGGNSSLQSHEFVNVKSALRAVGRGVEGPLSTAIHQLKTMHPIDAWKTLITPFAEAARVGEYLRARGHGASVLDGVYAAKHVTANFQNRGNSSLVRGLDRASLFLNPAIQAMDQALHRAGLNPFRPAKEGNKEAAMKYLIKAFASITLPSIYFWHLNHGDQDIEDLRKSNAGQKYWFFRSPADAPGVKQGDIVKIPKPVVDGQIFGSTMEAALDKMYADDPATMQTAVDAFKRDVAFNVLPTLGVTLLSLGTGTNVETGFPIIPQADQGLDPAHQGEQKASWLARTVAKKARPLVSENAPEVIKRLATPGGLDFALQSFGGMIGQDAMLALTQAADAESKGYVPSKEELPLVSRVFSGYPSLQVAPIQRFYRTAEQVEQVSQSLNHLLKEDPAEMVEYINSKQEMYPLIGVFMKTKQDIANYRRAILDVQQMPDISSEDRRAIVKQYQVLMIESARMANTYASEVNKAFKAQGLR